jgi:hypothetical protein
MVVPEEALVRSSPEASTGNKDRYPEDGQPGPDKTF